MKTKLNENIEIRQFHHGHEAYKAFEGKFYIVKIIDAACSPRHEYLHPDLSWKSSCSSWPKSGPETYPAYVDTYAEAEARLNAWMETQTKVK